MERSKWDDITNAEINRLYRVESEWRDRTWVDEFIVPLLRRQVEQYKALYELYMNKYQDNENELGLLYEYLYKNDRERRNNAK